MLVRRVIDARWVDLDDGVLRFEIEAKAFCHQMVRSIVGTLVEVGLGRRTPADVGTILRARDRRSPARWPRPTVCASGRSGTDGRRPGFPWRGGAWQDAGVRTTCTRSRAGG